VTINELIHIEHLYSASSRKLIRGALNSSKTEKSSLKVRKYLNNGGDKVLLERRSSEKRPFQVEGLPRRVHSSA